MNSELSKEHPKLQQTSLHLNHTKFWSIYLNFNNFRTTSIAGPFNPDGTLDSEKCSYLSTPHSTLEKAMGYVDFHINQKKSKGYQEIPTLKVEEDIVKIDFNSIVYNSDTLGKRPLSIESISDYSAEDSPQNELSHNTTDDLVIWHSLPANGALNFAHLKPNSLVQKESPVNSSEEEGSPINEEVLDFPLGQPYRELTAKEYQVEKLRGTNVKGLFMTPYVSGGVRCLWSGFAAFFNVSKQYPPPVEYRKNLPNGPVEGEFVLENGDRKAIKKILKSQNMEDWKKLKFIAYDAPGVKATFLERVKKLKKVLKKKKCPYIVLQEPIECQGLEHLNQEIEKQLNAGKKGVVLRQSQGHVTQFLRKAMKVISKEPGEV